MEFDIDLGTSNLYNPGPQTGLKKDYQLFAGLLEYLTIILFLCHAQKSVSFILIGLGNNVLRKLV